jgi:RND family efflux transporter MFP subunit
VKQILSAALAITASAAVACAPPAPRTAADVPPIAVSMGRAEVTALASSFEAGGVVRAKSTAVIASRVMAPILAVHVRPGDRVRRGAALVTLDARELTANQTRATAALTSAIEAARATEADIRSADAALGLARATYDRMRTLHEKRSATTQELDQATSGLQLAEAQLSAARARAAAATAARDEAQAAVEAASVATSYTILTAPFDGVVTERSVDPGSMAQPGASLLTIEDPSAFRLEVPMDEARAGQIAVGARAEVHLGSEDRDVPWTSGRVSEIARVDPATHSFVVKIELPGGSNLRSGIFGRARFDGPSTQALTIPAAAAIRRGQLTFAYTVDSENRARLQPISPGKVASDRVEVLAGLREGEPVVVNPPLSLSDGARVAGDRQ